MARDTAKAARKPKAKPKTSQKRKTSTRKKGSAKKKPAAKRSAAPAAQSASNPSVVKVQDPVVIADRAGEQGMDVAPVARAELRRDEPAAFAITSGVRQRDLTAFLRQLIMLLEAGTPIVKALNQLAARGENAAVRRLVGRIRDRVEEGNPLWQAFAHESAHFKSVTVNLIKAAEASGTLTTVLRRLVTYREKRELLRRQVIVAMIYPVILVLVTLAVIVLISSLVVPEFRELFSDMGVELNWFSKFIMGFTSFVAWFWWVPVLIVIGLCVLYAVWWTRSPLRKSRSDLLLLKTPIAGTIAKKRMISDFCRMFSLLQRSGVSMLSTLDLSWSSTNNQAFANAIQDMKDSVEQGEGFEKPLREAEAQGLIPPIAVDMMVTGEETGELDTICFQIADQYDEEIDLHVATLREALVPVFIVVIGFFVGAVVIALYLPLFNLIGEVAGGGL